QCIDQPFPTQPNKNLAVKCLTVKQPIKKLKSQVSNDKDMLEIRFDCAINDETICAKVKSTFEEAGRIITSALTLNTQIIVNVTFREMMSPAILGSARPFRLMPIKDDDGIERLYPQSLVKQLQLTSHPEFAPVDIIADFNSLVALWFEGDPPITSKQVGFLELILHELMHGLGFVSAWGDYFPKAATPEVNDFIESENSNSKAMTVFGGFQEKAFDKYLVIFPDNVTTSSYINELNKFADGSAFKNFDDFYVKFIASPQYLVAKEIYNHFVTPKSLVFKPSVSDKEEDWTYLETTLNPFERGSSVSHVDNTMYTNTSDFLMTYRQEHNRTLNDNIGIGGNYAGGAISYKLRLILESLGYTVKYPSPFPSNETDPVIENSIPTSLSTRNFAYQSSIAYIVGIVMIINSLL
ncbi:15194_t:CDS:2, partial [Funneliformis mosseae]